MATFESRRVILWDLPIDTSLWVVLSTVSSPEGVIRASLFTNRLPRIPNPFRSSAQPSASARCALIEFQTAASASSYVAHIQRHRIFISGKRHAFEEVQKCRVQGYLAGSISNDIDEFTSELLLAGRTRSLVIKNVTKSVIYDLLTSFGISTITNAKYGTNKTDGSTELVVEFASVIEAERIYQLISQGVYYNLGIAGLINPTFGTDSTTRQLDVLHDNLVIEVPACPIDAIFNKPPYNAQQKVFERKIPGQPIWHRTSTTTWFNEPPHHPATPHRDGPGDVHDVGLQEWLLSLEKNPPVEFKIIGHPGVTLTRTQTTWQVSPEDQLTLLMETTLHEKEYRKWWDDFFASKKTVNRRKWEEYGMYAKQRRKICGRWSKEALGAGTSDDGSGAEDRACDCEVCILEKEKCSSGWVPRVIKEWTAWKEHGTREIVLEDDEDLEITWASSSSEASDHDHEILDTAE